MTTARAPGPRQTPQARRSAPFPTSPRPPRAGGAARDADGARDDARGASTPVRTPPTRLDTTAPPAHRAGAAASTALLITALRRPTPTDADSRRPTPIGRRASPSLPPPHAPPGRRQTPQERRNRAIPIFSGSGRPRLAPPGAAQAVQDRRNRALPNPRPPACRERSVHRRREDEWGGLSPTPVPPRAESVQRARAAATAAALHAAQATRQPLHAAPPTAAVRPLLGQRPPPLRQCRRRPQGKEGATDHGTVTTATAADRRVTTTAATAQRMEKSGGAFRAPPLFSIPRRRITPPARRIVGVGRICTRPRTPERADHRTDGAADRRRISAGRRRSAGHPASSRR